MLKQHNQIFIAAFVVADMLVVAMAWLLAYYIRFDWGPVPAPLGRPPFSNYLPMVLFVWAIWGTVLRAFGLYHVTRGSGLRHEAIRVVQASSLAIIVLMAVAFLFWEKNVSFSRGVFVYFWLLACALLVAERVALRYVLSMLRARGYNQRYILVVGAGELAEHVARKIAAHPGLGFVVRGFLSDKAEDVGRELDGARVVGTYDDVQSILDGNGIDLVMIALPLESIPHLEAILKKIGPSMVDV
ncbi:MAG: nucleoside-diphosphate sugar epimerase/dehydratase, partial [Candidatus Binatia bacterium]